MFSTPVFGFPLFSSAALPRPLSIRCLTITPLRFAIRSLRKFAPRLCGRSSPGKDDEVLAILTEYTSDGKHVAVTGTLDAICRDPKDDMIFECRLKSQAEIILSGDHDLLSLKTYRGIQVLTARQYLDRFTSPSL